MVVARDADPVMMSVVLRPIVSSKCSGKPVGCAAEMAERLVVIGGDAAGMSAASQARRRRGPDDLAIVAFERGNFTSYSACGIPYHVGDVVPDLDALIVRRPDEFAANDIAVHIRTEAVEVDLDRRAVKVRELDSGDERWEGWDQLVIATGAKPIRPPLEGIDARNIFGVQVLDDGVAIRRAVDEQKPKRAVVVGGGYIGLEMAEAMVKRGIDVTLVEGAEQPMSTMDADMGTLLSDAMRNMGIEVRTEEPVKGFDTEDSRVTAVVTEAGALPTDIVILGLGVRPNVDLAEAAEIPIGPSGGIVVDRQMRTRSEGVWSAGDCAEKWHRIARSPVAIALGTHANKEGRVAGINIGGGYATFPGVVGTAASKVCDLELARTGLKESEASDAGFEYLTVTIESTTRAGYYPDTKKMKTKLVVEKRSGRLLGAQIVGEEGAAKRIDALATALWNEMLVDDIQHLDLSYAPPFAPVWDPILIAARKAWEKVEETRKRDPAT
jgi:NADPH-dependent 2,4-dienoyl-CoA reductase/sulfur reductase-like enzyme